MTTRYGCPVSNALGTLCRFFNWGVMMMQQNVFRILAIGALMGLVAACAEPPPVDEHGQPIARSGEEVYRVACASCHAGGRAGAPRVGEANSAHWQQRYDELGWQGLMSHTVQGWRRMPPRGNCFNCSDEELADSLAHVLSLSHVKRQRDGAEQH